MWATLVFVLPHRLGFELSHCGIMLAAVILLMYYLFNLTPGLRFSTA
jgi:hypothetical protein